MKLYMLCGFPGSGKSSFIDEFFSRNYIDTITLSTDDAIERFAHAHGKTYDEVFADAIKGAETYMYDRLDYAIARKDSIIWDQTNLTIKTRAKKLNKVPPEYERIALDIHTPDFKTLASRLNSRPGKIIPKHVVWSMMETYQPPTVDEGFSKVFKIIS